jgi:NAD(P)H-flavin reductase
VRLLFSNKTKDDILIKDHLDRLAQINSHFKVFHTLTRHKPDLHGEWEGFTGRVSIDMIRASDFPQPSENTLIAMCGPKDFSDVIKKMLLEAGYPEDNIF